ncbi:putative bifunctional diguanylate cyclase/phosphodiesterase [Pelagerythrobacter sp.]|uniref:putative bifunctional diguanylate cyclase/phosphodiesterase n=1 Tax=Pelagerythrobacter sp. TaxID=2800702 RepID=UPI0035B0A9E2
MLTAILLAVVVSIGFAVLVTYREHCLRAPVERAEELLGEATEGRITRRAAAALRAFAERPAVPEQRLLHIHALSGLPTREPLISRMSADGSGILALLALRDYDRLCAFDPALAERFLLAIVDRLGVMLPPERLLAQTDRTHLAIWLGHEEPVQAEAEIAAMAYALGDRWSDGDRDMFPEIAVRTGRFDPSATSPQALLSQTLSSFSVPLISDVREEIASIDPGVQARERYQVEQDLRQAVARDELRMQFQPLIDAMHGRVCGAEALVRWQHPERGLVPPGRFIPIMEAANLSHEIGLWALNHALREARHWRGAGHSDLRMAVNISGHQLDDEELPILIERTLARHGLGGDALEIELTESVALADGDRAPRLCEALRGAGIRIAIDDFGTGYSSFASLTAVGFDKIKIDRAFVTDVDSRRDSQAICASILALGRGLGIKVLAEGVETAAEFGWLRAHSCELFQGFYFSRPLDSAAFLDFVHHKGSLDRLLRPAASAPSERLRA